MSCDQVLRELQIQTEENGRRLQEFIENQREAFMMITKSISTSRVAGETSSVNLEHNTVDDVIYVDSDSDTEDSFPSYKRPRFVWWSKIPLNKKKNHIQLITAWNLWMLPVTTYHCKFEVVSCLPFPLSLSLSVGCALMMYSYIFYFENKFAVVCLIWDVNLVLLSSIPILLSEYIKLYRMG